MQKYEIRLSRGKAYALMAAYVVIGAAMAVVGLKVWQQAEGDTAARAFIMAWAVAVVVLLVTGLRRLSKRRLTTWLPSGMRPSGD